MIFKIIIYKKHISDKTSGHFRNISVVCNIMQTQTQHLNFSKFLIFLV